MARAIRRGKEAVVLKIGMPHMEADHEIDALRFLNGDPTVQLIEADDARNGMLLESCDPGNALRSLTEPEQDVVIAQLLRRFWRSPRQPHRFRPLSTMTAHWSDETKRDAARWPDPGLVQEGLRLFETLARPTSGDVLLATDLHAGNVLRAQREPWLVIDPKPFIGDPAYDATQHLRGCASRMRTDPLGTIQHFSDLLEIDHERVRLWVFARASAEPRSNWPSWNDESMELARTLAP
ncbi:MAG: aminoglycoside phosphotransferase family protein [Actinomycetota bacterium]